MERKFKSPEEFNKKCEEYFENGGTPIPNTPFKLFTMGGIYNHLDICRDTWSDYGKKKGYSDTVKKARCRVEQCIEELSLLGVIDKTCAIFNLKNNFHWRDKPEEKPAENPEKIDNTITVEVVDNANNNI